jgi:translation initiation factor IF-3
VDLVEIAPMAKPAGVPLMDFGKFKYAEAKRAHEAKLKQKQIQVKEVKLRPGTDERRLPDQAAQPDPVPEEGDKAKVTLRFRGREMAHQEFGMRLLERVKADLEEVGAGRADAQDGRAPDDHGAWRRRRSTEEFPEIAGAGAGGKHSIRRKQVVPGC